MMKLLLLLTALFFFGCSGSKESKRSSDADFTEELKKYEASFQPSDYNPDLDQLFKKEKESTSLEGDVPPPETQQDTAELIPGFRVQVFSSSDIDEANTTMATVQGLFPEEWFYLVYDPPTYKIRAGNFLTRFDADRFVNQLASRGYREAWVVPEKVFKNPPVKPQDKN